MLYYFPGFHISNTWSWAAFYRNILIRIPWAEASWKSSAKPPLGGLLSTLNWRGQKETYNAYEHRWEADRPIAPDPKVRSTAFLDHFLSRDHSSTDIKPIPLELILSAERRARCENWNTSFREGSNLWTGWSIDAENCKLCLHMFGHFSFIVIHPYYFALCIGILNCMQRFIRYRLFILLFSRSLTSHLPRGFSRHLGDVFISRLPFLKLIFSCKMELDKVGGGGGGGLYVEWEYHEVEVGLIQD